MATGDRDDLVEQRGQLLRELADIGDLRQGSLRTQYSRDKRPDCVQVVIALIVTPEGFPLAYEVMPGNTTDQTTLAGFLEKIERQYGRSDRVWMRSWTAAFPPRRRWP